MRRRVSLHVLPLCLLLWAPRRGAAQEDPLRVELETGTAWLRQTGIPQSLAGASGATITRQTDRSAVAAIVLGACGASGSCAVQGVASAAWFAPPGSAWRWNLEATASDLAYDGARPATGGVATVREYVGNAWRSVYAGAGLGAVHGPVTRGLAVAEAGGWWLGDSGRWSLDVRTMRVPTTAELDSLGVGAPALPTPTFTDVAAGWSREAPGGRFAVSAAAGWRGRVAGGGIPNATWASGTVTAWLTPRLGLLVSAGRALEDLTRGTPNSRYVSVSLRVRLHGPPSWVQRRTFPATVPVVTASVADSGTKELRVRIAGADRVELMADFTGWAPRALTRNGNAWTFVGDIPSGPHRLAVRIDDGPWVVPANLPTVHDEFGGAFGLITLP